MAGRVRRGPGGTERTLGNLHWTDDTIRWMRDAAHKSRYYETIAERIAAYLPPSARVFDAGGGLGDLAIWLSYHVRHVTVIERDPKAVAAFRERCPQNVTALLGDVFSYVPDKLFDALALCFFGRPDEILTLAREITCGKTFVVQSTETKRGFSPDGTGRRSITICDMEETLKKEGVPYTLELFEVEHGQPFCSEEDAAKFFSFYAGKSYTPQQVRQYLRETGNSELPLYYAQTRKLGLLVFDAGQMRRV